MMNLDGFYAYPDRWRCGKCGRVCTQVGEMIGCAPCGLLFEDWSVMAPVSLEIKQLAVYTHIMDMYQSFINEHGAQANAEWVMSRYDFEETLYPLCFPNRAGPSDDERYVIFNVPVVLDDSVEYPRIRMKEL